MQTQQVKTITENLEFIKSSVKQFDELSQLIEALIRNNKRTSSKLLIFSKEKKKLNEAAETAHKEIEHLNHLIEQLSMISAKIKILNTKVNELFKVFFGDES